VAARLAR